MKEAVSYILNNCYFTIGGEVFRQIIDYKWDLLVQYNGVDTRMQLM